jgi:DNA mismatch repair protein MutL
VPNRIHQLSTEISNQIAAGEVIERPANAVKELVENALDAGARRIQIDIESGGKKLICVRDDGTGMSADDAVLCLQRHATSKITGADDLWRIQTLGFRGEALPSLASVSRLEITTREEEAEVGTRLVVEAGAVLDVSDVGCPRGTEIAVRNLFFNTPARFKFLKSDAAEAARISEMIGHLALANPAVSFVLKHNGNEQLRVEAGGESFNALVAVLGRDTARQMLPITTTQDSENIRVTGFVGRPQLTRANRVGQLFFVNGRVIRSQTLQHAFRAAYEGLIHGRDRYPVGVVFLQVAPGEVDVNVHPTKSEVRFLHEDQAHHALRVAVRETLIGAQLAPSWDLKADSSGVGETGSAPVSHRDGRSDAKNETPSNKNSGVASSPTASAASTSNLFTPPPSTAPSAFSQSLTPTPEERERYAQHMKAVRNGTQPQTQPPSAQQPVAQPPSQAHVATSQPQPQTQQSPPTTQPLTTEPMLELPTPEHFTPQTTESPASFTEIQPKTQLKLRPLAQITNNSYMVCESEDGIYIVNQHRAHERILADNTIAAAKLKSVESQRLIIPFTVEVGARAVAAFAEHGQMLAELGFDVEAFGGNALLVRAVPALVSQGDYERAFGDLLDELVSGHAGSGLDDRRNALLTMLACKNAIKAGDPLPLAAMQRLVDDLALVENPSICPHGQPILFQISSDELHKKFERAYATK